MFKGASITKQRLLAATAAPTGRCARLSALPARPAPVRGIHHASVCDGHHGNEHYFVRQSVLSSAEHYGDRCETQESEIRLLTEEELIGIAGAAGVDVPAQVWP